MRFIFLISFSDNIIPSNDSSTKGALYFPIYGSMTTVKFQSKSFFPVVESPGVIFLQSNVQNGNAAEAVMKAVLQGWPVLVLTLIMAALSGIVIWALVSIASFGTGISFNCLYIFHI